MTPADQELLTIKALLRSIFPPVCIWLGSRTSSIFSSKKKVDPWALATAGTAATKPVAIPARTSRRFAAASNRVVIAGGLTAGAKAEAEATRARAINERILYLSGWRNLYSELRRNRLESTNRKSKENVPVRCAMIAACVLLVASVQMHACSPLVLVRLSFYQNDVADDVRHSSKDRSHRPMTHQSGSKYVTGLGGPCTAVFIRQTKRDGTSTKSQQLNSNSQP